MERKCLRWCNTAVIRKANWRVVRLTSLALILLAGCSSSPAHQAAVHTFAGGCNGTVLTDATPPLWAQAGWKVAQGEPWPTRWAFGTSHDTVAYLFAHQLVAGLPPRANGGRNKVLWETKDSPSGANLLVQGHPLGQSHPVVSIAGGPSLVDLPSPGCWTFRLSWGSAVPHSSIINLEVLPSGSLSLPY